MRKKTCAVVLIFVLLLTLLSGCAPQTPTAAAPAATEAAKEKVTLTVAGAWEDCRALDEVAKAFSAVNPDCTIVYEYIQDYYPSLAKRLEGDSPVDLFFTRAIQSNLETSVLLPYALELTSRTDLNLSDTFDGLIDNFMFYEGSNAKTKLYAIPLGAEMRVLFVNKTLLKSLDLEVPTDQASLLAACAVLKEHGYTPFHGNPGMFSHQLMYPWICNLIANADDPKTVYDKVNAREPGVSEMFREPYQFLYTLVENGYYDYKRAQSEKSLFVDSTDEAYSRDFLNIRLNGETYEKADDLGQVAFMPAALALKSTLDKTKEDYHSAIEYAAIPAPIGPEGGYSYLSPARGIAISKNSVNVDWAVKFLDFLFRPENNKTFASIFDVIPNTKEAFAYVKSLYNIPENHISHLGQVTFDYDFYNTIIPSLTDVAKANNPKYMQDDGAGNLTLYPLDHYLEELEDSFSAQ